MLPGQNIFNDGELRLSPRRNVCGVSTTYVGATAESILKTIRADVAIGGLLQVDLGRLTGSAAALEAIRQFWMPTRFKTHQIARRKATVASRTVYAWSSSVANRKSPMMTMPPATYGAKATMAEVMADTATTTSIPKARMPMLSESEPRKETSVQVLIELPWFDKHERF